MKLTAKTLGMSAIESIRARIISGQLRPGSLINQVELAEQLGISRGPVREAMQRLVEEGLVVFYPYKGTFVAPLSRRDLGELYGLRATLEAMAVELFMQRVGSEHLDELEAILLQLRRATAQRDTLRLTDLDLAFHTRIVELSGHGRLLQIWRQQLQHLRRALALLHRVDPDIEMVEGNHRPLLEAIRRGDGPEAQRLFRLHCLQAGEKLLRRWAEEEGEQ